jgi:RNA-directed DNA polymerase
MTKTSTGVQELRRRIATKAKAEPDHRFWGLYSHVRKHDVLMEAYRDAKANRGAHGVDGKTFEDVENEGLQILIETLSQELCEGTYRHSPLREVRIPKDNGKERIIKIACIRDRIVQGALKTILEPIFEMDFQEGSFGYRPRRTAHQARERIRQGLGKGMFDVIDLDLKSYFDTVRHDILLGKIAKRVDDPEIMNLCKKILKSGGKIGLPQGSVVGPVFANLYLNDIDKMLEKAQIATRDGPYEIMRYTRFADDLTILVNAFPTTRHKRLLEKVMHRLRQEFEKLHLTINDEKTKVVHLDKGEAFNFLGYTFRLAQNGKKKWIIARPMRKKRTEFLRSTSKLLKQNRFCAVEDVVQNLLNPKIRGWVNYFRHGNSGKDLSFVRWQIEKKIRKFASRQTPTKRGGRRWSTWTISEIYGDWKLHSDYRVSREHYGARQAT